MLFNDFVKTALSNDIICIVSEIIRGQIIGEPEAAFRLIDGKYANREIDRFTLIPRTDGIKGTMIAVTLKGEN